MLRTISGCFSCLTLTTSLTRTIACLLLVLHKRQQVHVTMVRTGKWSAPQGPCLTVFSLTPLVLYEWCVAVMNAIFMVICSWRQLERTRRSRRRLANPLSTNNMKGAPCGLKSWHSSSPSSLKRIIDTRRDDLCYRSRRRRYAIFLPRHRPQGRPCADICSGVTPSLQIMLLS